MNSHHHHSEAAAVKYRTVASKADGSHIVLACWSTFDKALGCSFGFYAAEKHRYETSKSVKNAVYSAKYFSVFVQRPDPRSSSSGWTTVTKTLLCLDFDCTEKMDPKRRSFKSGEECTAMLLGRKTRKGGWIAAIPDTDCEGPITNSDDVPAGLLPGDTVKLRIGAIDKDGSRIQFTWVHALTN